MNSSMADPERANPVSVSWPLLMVAVWRMGKFRRPLPPVSASPESFKVTNGDVPRLELSVELWRSIPISCVTLPTVPLA